jgi:glutathione S-transferase
MTLVLHGLPQSHNTRKVLAVAHHLGLEIALQPVDILAKASFTPAFRALNPNGLTPVLVDGDFVLWESAAILIHLASTAQNKALWPEGRARIEQLRWLFWNSAHWDHATDPVFIELVVKGLEGRGGPDPVALDHAYAAIARFGDVLDKTLVTQPFLGGDMLGLADFAVASCLQYRHIVDYRVSAFPALMTWLQRIEALPAWRATEPDWTGF